MNTSLRFFCAIFSACLACAATAGTVTTAAQDRALFAEFSRQYARAVVCAARQPGFAEAFAPALRTWRLRNEAAIRLGDAFSRSDAPPLPVVAPAGEEADKALLQQCDAVLKWLENT